MKSIPFFISLLLAAFLNHQASQQNYPLGFFGSGLAFTICVGYCSVFLSVKGVAFLKAQNLKFLAYWLLIPGGLVALFFIALLANEKFRHERIFSSEQYSIIGDFMPTSGGRFYYWAMEKRGMGWYRLGQVYYGRIREYSPQVVLIDDKPVLLQQNDQDRDQRDTILLK